MPIGLNYPRTPTDIPESQMPLNNILCIYFRIHLYWVVGGPITINIAIIP